jgi:hypothetical protein
MEHIEQLPLVLVDPLDMHIKDRVNVDCHIIVTLKVLGKLLLIFL